LHNGLRNVTLLVDWHGGARLRQTTLPTFYRAELPKAPYVSGLLQGARLAWPPRAFDATWYTASAFAGERFLLVGDAGLFIDPLSSEGVHKAMASAITGAVVVNTLLRRPTMTAHAAAFYDEMQQATYETHYREATRYYRQETRWQDHPFWQKRSFLPPLVSSRESSEDRDPQYTIRRPHSGVPDAQSTSASPQKISHLRLTPGVAITERPVIEGPFVELREVVVAPPYPRGVRFLQAVCVPTLLKIVEAKSAVADIMAAYLSAPEGKQCPPESIRQVLARLYQEDILCLPD
jgi:hypothetical protein